MQIPMRNGVSQDYLWKAQHVTDRSSALTGRESTSRLSLTRLVEKGCLTREKSAKLSFTSTAGSEFRLGCWGWRTRFVPKGIQVLENLIQASDFTLADLNQLQQILEERKQAVATVRRTVCSRKKEIPCLDCWLVLFVCLWLSLLLAVLLRSWKMSDHAHQNQAIEKQSNMGAICLKPSSRKECSIRIIFNRSDPSSCSDQVAFQTLGKYWRFAFGWKRVIEITPEKWANMVFMWYEYDAWSLWLWNKGSRHAVKTK